jgi:hypothetical protein
MSHDFIPLSSLAESLKTSSFEDLSTEKPPGSPSSSPVKEPDSNPGSAAAPPPAAKTEAHESTCQEPRILLDREGEKITQIRVLCSCGQSIVLDCKYPS